MAATLPATVPTLPPVSMLPLPIAQFVATGEEPSHFRRDLTTAGNQIPRWLYATLAGYGLWAAARSYRDWKKKRPTGG